MYSLIWVGWVLVDLFHKNHQILIMTGVFPIFECMREHHVELIHHYWSFLILECTV